MDTCSFEQDLVPGRVITVRYTGPEVNETQVQCVDLANNNAPVVFPKSRFTVRVPNVSPYMLMPCCPDGNASDGFACSKLDSQSQRGSEYRDTLVKWKASDPKTKQSKIDLQFDPAYVAKIPPFTPTVPYGAKLFCAAVNKKGEVVIAGTAQYPAASSAAPADANFYQDKAARGSSSASPSRGGAGGAAPAEMSKESAKETAKESAKEAVKEAATGASSPAATALEALGRVCKP